MDLVVANYNNGKFLPQLVESVRLQTSRDWQLYIVDDFSSDDSNKYLKMFDDAPGITIIRLDQNHGATHAFKTGIEAGTSDLIGLIGADDALIPEAIETMALSFNANNETVLAYSECMDCDEHLNPIRKRDHAKPLDKGQPVFEQLYSIFNFIVFRRSAYEQTLGLDSSLRRAMDHDLLLKMDETGPFQFVSHTLYLYRTHANGISQGNNWPIAELYSLKARINAYNRRQTKPISRAAFKQLKIKYHRRVLYLQQSLDNKPLRSHIIATLLLNPFEPFKSGLIRDALKSLLPQNSKR